MTLVFVVPVYESAHKERTSLNDRHVQQCHAVSNMRWLTLSRPHATVASTQNTPVRIEPSAKALMVFMIPADPVLGIPIRLSDKCNVSAELNLTVQYVRTYE